MTMTEQLDENKKHEDKIANLTARFNTIKIRYNGYASKMESIHQDIAEAKTEFEEKYPGIENLFNRRALSAKRQQAEDVVINRTRWDDTALAVNIMALNRQIDRFAQNKSNDEYDSADKVLQEIEAELETRHSSIKECLGVISGNTALKV